MLAITVKDSVKADDYVMIGDDIKVMFKKVGTRFRIGIEAPKDVPILRKEVYEKQLEERNKANET